MHKVPERHVAAIAQDRARRLMVKGDPAEAVTAGHAVFTEDVAA